MLFLCTVSIPSFDKAKPFLEGHAKYIKENYEKGFFKIFGPYQPVTGGYVIIEAESMAQVEKIISTDPLTLGKACVNEVHEIAVGNVADDILKYAKR